jgi:hypothetical protein
MNPNRSIPGFSDIEFDQVVVRQLDRSNDDFPTVGRVVCPPDHARRIVSALVSLTEDEQARCHIPGFAVDLHNDGEVVFTANICWSCNNMRLSGSKAPSAWATFDATCAPAKLILALCIELFKQA